MYKRPRILSALVGGILHFESRATNKILNVRLYSSVGKVDKGDASWNVLSWHNTIRRS
jgi:hypothetical protein